MNRLSHVVSHRAALVDLYSGYVSLVTNLMWFMTMLLMAKISIVDAVRMVQDKQKVMLKMKKLYLSPVRVKMVVVVGTWLDMWTMEHTAMLTKTQKYSPESCPGSTAC